MLQEMANVDNHREGLSRAGSIWAVIPARGGSKSVPRKNVRMFAGMPLLAHTIQHAIQAGSNRVIVSTDDAEIGAVANDYGAEVVWRPREISGDTAKSESALLHVLDSASAETDEPDLVLFLQPTSPLRDPRDIRGAIQYLIERKADSLFAATRLHWFVWRSCDDKVTPLNYSPRHRPTRQEAPEDLIETGSFYIFKPWVLRECGCRLGGKIVAYKTAPRYAHQIDDPGDFTMLEAIAGRIPAESPPSFEQITMLVLDFDGVLTDNRVFVDGNGTETVCCSREDSLGLKELQAAGVTVVVLSTETDAVVSRRCKKLNIRCIGGLQNKLAALQELLQSCGTLPRNVAYVGNDRNDMECMRHVGFPIAVCDAVPEIRAVATFITRNCGGRGAVREVCDMLLHARHNATLLC